MTLLLPLLSLCAVCLEVPVAAFAALAHWCSLVVIDDTCEVTRGPMTCICVIGCGCVAVAWLQTDNMLGAEGAKALVPELVKLTQLQMLHLESE